MIKLHLFRSGFLTLGLIALVACSSSGPAPAPSTGISIAQPVSVSPTATPVPIPVPEPKPTATSIPHTEIEPSAPQLGSVNLTKVDPTTIVAQAMSSPEAMSCMANSLGMAPMMELMNRLPTDEEMQLIFPCLEMEPAKAEIAPSDVVQEEPVVPSSPGPVRPTGVEWYEGPLFDTHMHLMGLAMPNFGEVFTTSRVRHIMDRHDIESGIGFFTPPLPMFPSAAANLVRYIDELDDRLVTLLMPLPIDLGFNSGFLGFAQGTYTRELLEPWYPPNGTFDGFGEIAFYRDTFSALKPGSPQLNDVYSVVAESNGVVMIHQNSNHTPEEYAQVIRQYPEINFLFHGTKDFYGNGPDERWAVLELLDMPDLDNVYYTLDVGSTLNTPDEGGVFMDFGSADSMLAFIDSLDFQELVQRSFDDYSSPILDHPDKVMWGTDFLNSWHFEDAGSDVAIDFSRRFIAMLPEDLQEKFAYSNAQRVFGHYLD